ncbi:MAG: translation initiation factor eIF-1A [Candidatus Pacearchaeota archaeon]
MKENEEELDKEIENNLEEDINENTEYLESKNKSEDKHKESNSLNETEKIRVRLPRKKELIGVVDQRVGGSRMIVKCSDGKSRNCRIPGRLKRSLWIREGDYVIIEPWEFDDSKGDILFKYNPSEVTFLKQRGYLENISEEF